MNWANTRPYINPKLIMPYCPECEYKYPRNIEQCPVCATPLVDTLDEDASYVCDECKEPVAKNAQSCANCGTVFVEDLRCLLHPDTSSHGICVVCGQHLCPECADRQTRRYFCEHDAQEEIQPDAEEDKEKSTVKDWEAVLYQRYLEQEGVDSRIFDEEHDRHLINGSDHISGIKLIAPFGGKKQVLQILMEREIEGEEVLFQCERCSAISGTSNPVCPNCGR